MVSANECLCLFRCLRLVVVVMVLVGAVVLLVTAVVVVVERGLVRFLHRFPKLRHRRVPRVSRDVHVAWPLTWKV